MVCAILKQNKIILCLLGPIDWSTKPPTNYSYIQKSDALLIGSGKKRMKKNNWKKIKVGDFFIADMKVDGQTLIYQKIDETKVDGYNAILLNTGQLANVYEGHFQRVEVTFEAKPID